MAVSVGNHKKPPSTVSMGNVGLRNVAVCVDVMSLTQENAVDMHSVGRVL